MTNLTKKIDLNNGYNPTGNLITFKLLQELPPEMEKMYREELKNEDEEKYEEFSTFEKEFKTIS